MGAIYRGSNPFIGTPPAATTTSAGLMTAEDKIKLNSLDSFTGAVSSVNEKTGDVVLSADDVGAMAADKFWTGTLEEYNAIETKDDDTYYYVTDVSYDVSPNYVFKTEKGAANGVATLDEDGKLIQVPTAADVGARSDTWLPTAAEVKVSNRNLLDNPWFTINQRGASGLVAAWNIGFDRWIFGNAYCNKSDNTVTFSASEYKSLTSCIGYSFEDDLKNSLINKDVTFSVLKNDDTIAYSTFVYTIPSENDYHLFSDENIYISINVLGQFNIAAISETTIKAIKLELGTVSTLAYDSPPNYWTEYYKCVTSTADSVDTYANKPYNALSSNRNLIDNPWFTVNSRGQTIYVSTNYTVDRWRLANATTTFSMTISDSGINLKDTTGGANYAGQLLDSKLLSDLATETVTLSILMSDGNVYSASGVFGSESLIVAPPSDSGLLLLYHNPTDGGIGFRCGNDSQIIRAVKLELGSISTLAFDSPPNYAEEFFKCCNSTADSSDTYANKCYNPTASNRNLLDNPAMQIAQAGYGGTHGTIMYVADRWSVPSYAKAGTAISESDGIITVTHNTGTTYTTIEQVISDNVITHDAVMTASVRINDIIYSEQVTAPAGDPTTDLDLAIIDGWHFNWYQTGYGWKLRLWTSVTDASLTINTSLPFMKLELGPISTLAYDAPPNYDEELIKCQKYYNRFSRYSNRWLTFNQDEIGSSAAYFFTNIPEMRAAPTVNLVGAPLGIRTPTGTANLTTITFSASASSPTFFGVKAANSSTFDTTVTYRCQSYTTGSTNYLELIADL